MILKGIYSHVFTDCRITNIKIIVVSQSAPFNDLNHLYDMTYVMNYFKYLYFAYWTSMVLIK